MQDEERQERVRKAIERALKLEGLGRETAARWAEALARDVERRAAGAVRHSRGA